VEPIAFVAMTLISSPLINSGESKVNVTPEEPEYGGAAGVVGIMGVLDL
jgi:hypothetical protein